MAATIGFENVLPFTPAQLAVTAGVNISEGPSTTDWADNLPGFLASVNDTIIQVDQASTFTFGWSATGSFAGWLLNPCTCKVDVFYELMGPGEATFVVPAVTVPMSVSGTATINVAPNTVSEGVYRIVARMMIFPPTGNIPASSPICGFTDMGLVEYYAG